MALSDSGRQFMSWLLRKMADHTMSKANKRFDMKEVQKKYSFKKNKIVKLYVFDVPFERFFYFNDDGTQHMVKFVESNKVNCTIKMSAKTVLDLLHGTSKRLKPNGSGHHMIPYNFSTAYAFNDITVDQDAYQYSDLKYMVEYFEKEVFGELQVMLKGSLPDSIE